MQQGIEGWFAQTEGSAELFRLVLRVCLPLPRPVPQHLLLPEFIMKGSLLRRGKEERRV